MAKFNFFWPLVLLAGLAFFLSTWGLTESSEARYAQISSEMYESSDWLHPSYLGIHHYHKPPLTYYITSLGYFIFGKNEWGARFFLTIALLTQLWLVYRITQLFYNERKTAIAATLIYFSYPIVQVAAKNLTTDAYLTCFIFASIYSFLQFRHQQQVIYLYLFYLFCGLAFLTKGPVGLMPQLLFAICYNRIYKSQFNAGFHRYTSLIIGIAISFSWFLLLVIDRPGLFDYFIKHQLVERVASDTFNRSKPWWYYIATMPLLALPAFIYFFDYLLINFSLLKKGPGRGSKILLISLVVSLMVFSLSASKLVLYVLPLYLFIAMISANHLVNIKAERRMQLEKISFGFTVTIFLLLVATCFIDLPLKIPVTQVLLLSCLFGLISLDIYLQQRTHPVLKGPLLNVAFMSGLIFLLPGIMKKNEIAINSIKPVAAFINENAINNPASKIAVYDYLLPSASFYTGKKIITLYNGNASTKRETEFETDTISWRKNYISLAGIKDSNSIPNFTMQSGDFIIARKKNPIPDSLAFLRTNLPHQVVMDKWIIYY